LSECIADLGQKSGVASVELALARDVISLRHDRRDGTPSFAIRNILPSSNHEISTFPFICPSLRSVVPALQRRYGSAYHGRAEQFRGVVIVMAAAVLANVARSLKRLAGTAAALSETKPALTFQCLESMRCDLHVQNSLMK